MGLDYPATDVETIDLPEQTSNLPLPEQSDPQTTLLAGHAWIMIRGDFARLLPLKQRASPVIG